MESEYSEVPPTGREPSTEDLQIKIERLRKSCSARLQATSTRNTRLGGGAD